MNEASPASMVSPTRRRWRWLGFKRRRDQIAFGFVAVSFLSVYAFMSLPGVYRLATFGVDDSPFESAKVRHGWPWTMLVRDRFSAPPPKFQYFVAIDENVNVVEDLDVPLAPPWLTREGWTLAGRNASWRPWAAAGNGAVAVVLLALIWGGFQWRMRRRGSLLRFTLLDVGAAATFIAIVLAWWRHAMTGDEFDRKLAGALGTDVYATRAYVGPEWVVRLWGARGLPFWRTTEIYFLRNQFYHLVGHPRATAPSTQPRLAEFESLTSVHVDAGHQTKLRILEAVSAQRLSVLEIPSVDDLDADCIRAIRGRNLAWLSIMQPRGNEQDVAHPFQAIGQCESLRGLAIGISPTAPEDTLIAIATLPRLESLIVFVGQRSSRPSVMGRQLRAMRQSKTLRRIEIVSVDVDDACIDDVIELRGLTEVTFAQCAMAPERQSRLRASRPDLIIRERSSPTILLPIPRL